MIHDEKKDQDMNNALIKSEKLTIAGELAAGIAHELRNALTSLRGFIQLAVDDYPGMEKYAKIMLSEMDRIHHLNNELMELAKPKESKFARNELRSILENVITLLNTQAILHDVQIFIECPLDQKEIYIYCNEDKIKQVFINLIKNAIEAMPNGGMIWVKVKRNQSYVHIQIIDEGVGVPTEIIAKIGQAFITTKKDGMGLGLKLSSHIIKLHGGVMEIKSELGMGTTIDLQLPVIE